MTAKRKWVWYRFLGIMCVFVTGAIAVTMPIYTEYFPLLALAFVASALLACLFRIGYRSAKRKTQFYIVGNDDDEN